MKLWIWICLTFALVSCNSDQPKQELSIESTYALLAKQLDTIYLKDQNTRIKIDSISQKIDSLRILVNRHSINTAKQDSIFLKNAENELYFLSLQLDGQDIDNLSRVRAIIDKYGWLGPDVIGERGNLTLFLVIQHSKLKVQEKYLPMIREAVRNKRARASDLALLVDRIEIRNNRPQIYGSQIGGALGKPFIYPIFDEINVNKRRAEVGLEPIEVYVKHWGINYKSVAK